MSSRNVKETYTKTHPDVQSDLEEMHEQFIDQLNEAIKEKGMTKNQLTVGVGGQAPLTYNTLNPQKNTTFVTAIRFARAAGKKVVIKLVDTDEETE